MITATGKILAGKRVWGEIFNHKKREGSVFRRWRGRKSEGKRHGENVQVEKGWMEESKCVDFVDF